VWGPHWKVLVILLNMLMRVSIQKARTGRRAKAGAKALERSAIPAGLARKPCWNDTATPFSRIDSKNEEPVLANPDRLLFAVQLALARRAG